MSKTVKEHCFARISVISQPFWLFLGSFRRVNPCGLRVRVDAGTGEGQVELPVSYPRQSLGLPLCQLRPIHRDPARHQGPRNIRHNIAMKTGIHLTRDFVTGTMHTHDPEGFTKQNPTAKRIHREPKVPLGISDVPAPASGRKPGQARPKIAKPSRA